jgi:hypothetical protein
MQCCARDNTTKGEDRTFYYSNARQLNGNICWIKLLPAKGYTQLNQYVTSTILDYCFKLAQLPLYCRNSAGKKIRQ